MKCDLLVRIAALDLLADSSGLDAAAWDQRYDLEESLLNVHKLEEEFWCQRGHISWMLKGDRLSGHFFAIANGRQRRCLIVWLTIDGHLVEDPMLIENHILDFYSYLLPAKPLSAIAISPSLWDVSALVS